MNKEQFDQWMESPTTEYVLKYFEDIVKDKAESMAEVISYGGTLDHDEQLVNATICATLREVSEIDLGVITDFYDERREE